MADLVLGRLRARARPGHDEQPHARQRRASPTTRRSAAARARARTPTARAPCTWPCPTPSTPRWRRSSSSSRCGPWSTRCAAESGGAGAHRGGDGVVRELEALAPMRYSLITERRRHAPPGAEGGEPGAPGRNVLNGDVLPPKCSGELRPGDRLRIETPGGGGHGEARLKSRARAPDGWPSSAWGSWASRWPPTWRGRGSTCPCGRAPARRRSASRRSTACARPTSRPRPPRAPPRPSRWCSTRPRSRRCCWASDGAAAALGRGRAVRGHVHDRPHGRARDRQPAGRDGHRTRGRPGHRLAPAGRGRHAHDHGRGRGRGLRPGASRCSRPWAGWWCTSDRRVTGR